MRCRLHRQRAPRCVECLRAKVHDLKARLKAVRAMTRVIDADEPWPEMDAATDLRRKNWRKP